VPVVLPLPDTSLPGGGLNEAVHAVEWLQQVLMADEVLAGSISEVTDEAFPDRQSFPLIRIDPQEADDVMVVGTYRILTHLDFLIRVYSQSETWDEVRPLADRMDTVLHRSSGNTATLTVGACYRTEPFKDTEFADGKMYRVAGGFYRLTVYPLD
jgi:hypothetical protein